MACGFLIFAGLLLRVGPIRTPTPALNDAHRDIFQEFVKIKIPFFIMKMF